MARSEGGEPKRWGTTLLRSISEGARTVITVTERLNDLRGEQATLRAELNRLAESVYRLTGRADGIDQRFAEVDKRIDAVVKLAVRDELERRDKSDSLGG
jgi:predicted nuclease with TOPRIM domain